MPRRRAFDKKNSTTFSLVYRAQNDPLIHDPEASDMVFTEKVNPNQSKIKSRQELEQEFGDRVRQNEGEAANYGIFYDDSEYDYMQHLREVGASSDAYLVPNEPKKKGKQAVSLEDALRDMEIQADDGVSNASSRVSLAESLLPSDMLPSEFVQKTSYQAQQDVPDVIAGFQPDMDPRLREVLEALEDEAYVDDDDDVFDALQQEGEEVDLWEFERSAADGDMIQEEDEGWESDHTVKAFDPTASDSAPAEGANADWMGEFNKFKKDKEVKSKQKEKPGAVPADMQSSVLTGASSITGLRRKKRKGALTATSGYSMTSSVLRRTEELSVLDRRFDRIQEEYDQDEADESASMFSSTSHVSKVSALSKASVSSNAPSLIRADFDSIVDDFLGDYSQVGKRRMRKGKPQSSMEALDEIRRDLGPARIKEKPVALG
ncbi:Low temperature viability protein [Microthyrium microscopicum]|uniref:Low temperature viability protein n=1 Tax=Microthyrium microscopicum TaxID=703497 RepID=A0A6A6UBF4_9PEZI|nr:Low temperature viability protein [Microthyrium microscopicum]